MSTIGERLREERERLGLSQAQFAATGGVQKRAQINYEADERSPDAQYLAAVSSIGADVLYILIGERSKGAATREEARLLELFRASPSEPRNTALRALRRGSSGLQLIQDSDRSED